MGAQMTRRERLEALAEPSRCVADDEAGTVWWMTGEEAERAGRWDHHGLGGGRRGRAPRPTSLAVSGCVRRVSASCSVSHGAQSRSGTRVLDCRTA